MLSQLETFGNEEEDEEQEVKVVDPFQEVFDNDNQQEGSQDQQEQGQPPLQVGHPPNPPLDPGGRKTTPVPPNLKAL